MEMSFSLALKQEICQNRSYIRKHAESVCFGLILFSKRLRRSRILFSTECEETADLFEYLVSRFFNVSVKRNFMEQIDGKLLYELIIEDAESCGKVYEGTGKIFPVTENSPEFLRGLLCGAFLACANISDPQKSYHMEFSVHQPELFAVLCTLLKLLEIRFGCTERKSSHIAYIKSSGEIEDILTMLGAGSSAMDIMHVKVVRDMRNKVNRMTNCDTANIGRAVTAASEQVSQIRYIQKEAGLESLPEGLQEIARLRLENPDLSLSDLGKLLEPPLSRSGAYYRLKQIAVFAEKLRSGVRL